MCKNIKINKITLRKKIKAMTQEYYTLRNSLFTLYEINGNSISSIFKFTKDVPTLKKAFSYLIELNMKFHRLSN